MIPTRDLCVCVSASGAVHGHLGHLQCYSTSSRPHFRARETGSANVPLQDTSRKFQLANRCLSARAAQTTAAPHNRKSQPLQHARAVSDARPTRGCDDEAYCSWIHRCYGSVWRSNGSGRVVLWHAPCWLFYDARVADQRVSVDVTTNRNQRKIFQHFYNFLILVASPLQGSHNQDCDNLVEYSH